MRAGYLALGCSRSFHLATPDKAALYFTCRTASMQLVAALSLLSCDHTDHRLQTSGPQSAVYWKHWPGLLARLIGLLRGFFESIRQDPAPPDDLLLLL